VPVISKIRWTGGEPTTRLKAKPSARDMASQSRIMPQAGRVEKADVAEIQRQVLDAGRLLLAEVGVDDGNGRHVQLADGTDANSLAFRSDLAAERRDIRWQH
jgi:hypothetical protein